MIKRLDSVDVTLADLAQGIEAFSRNFDFKVTPAPAAKSATVSVGDAEIHLSVAAVPGAEGMSGLWLEASDIDALAAALESRGFRCRKLFPSGGRRVLEIDQAAANQTPLYVFDRKG